MRTAALLIAAWLAAPAVAAPPSFEEVRAGWRPSEAYLLDRNGTLLQQSRIDHKVRRLPWTPLAEISPALLRAILLAEDRRFYAHHGVDWRAVGAAAWAFLSGGPRRGASTLTMQVAAMLDPDLAARSRHRSWRQKLGQLREGLALERTWPKDRILEAYLNLVGYRGELQGVRAAAHGLFGKEPSGLNETEALLLAAALPSPNRDSAQLARRACTLAKAGAFSVPCSSLQDLAQALDVRPNIAAEARLAPELAAKLLGQPGESLTTTLDSGLQRQVRESLAQQLRSVAEKNVRDGAALVVDNRSGDVLAYVGSAGPYSRSPRVDGVRARRQAGSTLKPFLYELALERRYLTAASLLKDTPVHLETSGGLYIPQNYDRDFKGTVSLRTALASSLNVPAVRTLALVGVQRFRDRLDDLGFSGLREDGEYYGFSLALGSAEVSLMELVNAYRTLANGGMKGPLRLRLEEGGRSGTQIMNEPASFVIADVLADRAGRSVTFGLDNPLATRYWTAVKTGTSKDMRDNWCIGFSRKYTVGVWVGNFEGDGMHDVSGITGAAPVWLDIMDRLHGDQPSSSLPPDPPAGLVRRSVGFQPALEPARQEWFLTGTESEWIVQNPARSRPARIASPPNGVVIALDPDVPEAHQAIVFMADSARSGISFRLDGQNLASAEQPYKWRPLPGTHRLVLVGAEGTVLDTVGFKVRGVRQRAH